MNNIFKSIEKGTGVIAYEGIDQMAKNLNIQFSLAEQDYIALVMYKQKKVIQNLEYSYFVSEFLMKNIKRNIKKNIKRSLKRNNKKL